MCRRMFPEEWLHRSRRPPMEDRIQNRAEDLLKNAFLSGNLLVFRPTHRDHLGPGADLSEGPFLPTAKATRQSYSLSGPSNDCPRDLGKQRIHPRKAFVKFVLKNPFRFWKFWRNLQRGVFFLKHTLSLEKEKNRCSMLDSLPSSSTFKVKVF